MQWLLAAVIWVVFAGGTAMYFALRPTAPMATLDYQPPERIADELVLELTPTFSVEPDPFSLDQLAFRVRLDGQLLLDEQHALQAGEALRVPAVFSSAINELAVEANPASADQFHALRVRVMRGAEPVLLEVAGSRVSEVSLWCEPGAGLSDVVRFAIVAPQHLDGDEHGH